MAPPLPDVLVQPPQPRKVEPEAGIAVNDNVVAVKAALQVLPQLMAAGLEVTVPLPLPIFCTVNVLAANVAVTVLLDVIGISQMPAVLVQAPPHPRNREPDAATAVSVSVRSTPIVAVQVDPQLMPGCVDEVTVPAPLPTFVTVKVEVVAGTLPLSGAFTAHMVVMFKVTRSVSLLIV